MTKSVTAWHYTIGAYAREIEQEGVIRVATSGPQFHGEQPVVWFTIRKTFEPTALKGLEDNYTGELTDLSVEETEA